jgi:hypothetical protein
MKSKGGLGIGGSSFSADLEHRIMGHVTAGRSLFGNLDNHVLCFTFGTLVNVYIACC